MLFVGYDSGRATGHPPSSSSPSSQLPSSSSSLPSRPPLRPLPRVDTLHPSPPTLDVDSITTSLHSLYTRALRHLPSHPPLALPLLRQLLSHPLYRPLNRGDPGAASTLSRRLLHLHFLALHQLATLYDDQGVRGVGGEGGTLALQCWAYTGLSSPPLSATSVEVVVPVRMALARCAMRVGQVALARAVLEEVVEVVGVEGWEVVDALMDVLYVVGDHQALLSLARHALQRDRRYVKALLIYTQLHTLSPSASPSPFHQRCVEELRLVPSTVVQSVAAGLMRLSASVQSSAEVLPAAGSHEVRLTSMKAAALGELLLQTYEEVKGRRPEGKAESASIPTFRSLHRFLRWLKHRHTTQRAEAKNIGKAASLTTSSSAKSSSASSPISLSTPIIVAVPDDPPSAVAEGSSGRENREEAKRQQRREACSKALRSGLLGGIALDQLISASPSDASTTSDEADVSHPSTSTARSVPLYFPPPPPSSLPTFLASHASSACSNDGIIDLIRRYLCHVRLTRPRGLTSELLACLVLAMEEHRTAEAAEDVDDLLFSAAALLDCLAAPPSAELPPAVTGPALSALWSRLSLLAVGNASAVRLEADEDQREEVEEHLEVLAE